MHAALTITLRGHSLGAPSAKGGYEEGGTFSVVTQVIEWPSSDRYAW